MSTFTRAEKIFELSNYLGKVLEPVPDKKVVVDANADGNIDYYTAEVLTANDYYPFGMQMPGRSYTNGSEYRYGFNGQEKSDEISEGLTTAEFWEYDSRIGKRWNIEPLTAKYPGLSGYVTFSNNPILYADPDGKEIILLIWAPGGMAAGHAMIAIQRYEDQRRMVNGKMRTISVPLNSYDVYEIGPGVSIYSEAQLTRKGYSNPQQHYQMTKEQLITNRDKNGKIVTRWEADAPDGVITFNTTPKQDKAAMVTMDAKSESNALGYCAVGGDGIVTDNCTSYVMSVIPKQIGEKLDAMEVVEIGEKKIKTTTPVKLFNAAAKLKDAKILKDLPADKKNKPFLKAFYDSKNKSNGKNKIK